MAVSTDQVLELLYGNSGANQLNTANPFGFITSRDDILNVLNAQTDADYDIKQKEAQRAYNQAERTTVGNTRSATEELRRAMAGTTASRANAGAASATALQALLGLGQQNNSVITEGLQGLYKVQDDKTLAKSQNAVNALTQSNAAKQQEAGAALEQYNADATVRAGANQSLANLVGTIDTNKANKDIANTEQKQKITYGGSYTIKNK